MIAVVALTAAGGALARRIAAALGGRVHGLAGRVADADATFTDTAGTLRALWREGHAIVAVCAAGIVVRALGPLAGDKHEDAPAVAVAEDGSVAVPLLGGHRGANDLARRIAALTGGVAAITTASDTAFGVALDAPPPGWRLEDAANAKAVAAALLAGGRVRIATEDGWSDWLAPLPQAEDAAHTIAVSVLTSAKADLVYRPPMLALGVGCERGAPPEELAALIDATFADIGLSTGGVACLATIDLKEDEPAVLLAAERLGVPVRLFGAAALAAIAVPNPSDSVARAVGTPGVSEPAALAAAGEGATLIVPKRKSRRATCAVALAPRPIDPCAAGRARGRLSIVGIGPGMAAWRTAEAADTLRAADEVVGYRLYLDLIADLVAGKTLHETALGAEEARVALALERAAGGRHVALVSSGDAGIYGLATLACELVARGTRPEWARLDLRVVPGVSAMQAAASRVGAPLGHDFCAVSLSDLLTPWDAIERRLEAAAAADFVVALYNPASQRRAGQFARALAILARTRPPTTPVAIARNLGRDDERVEVTTLAEAPQAAIDMLTIVLVGASTTTPFVLAGRRLMFTPRGYAAKVP